MSILLLLANVFGVAEDEGIKQSQSIFACTNKRRAQCDTPTVAEGTEGLVAAWLGGPDEVAPKLDIWVSRFVGGKWAPPTKVAMKGRSGPYMSPVLHQIGGGPLQLYFRHGRNGAKSCMTESEDGGQTWAAARSLGRGVNGPVRNKIATMPDGSMLAPSGSSEWQTHSR